VGTRARGVAATFLTLLAASWFATLAWPAPRTVAPATPAPLRTRESSRPQPDRLNAEPRRSASDRYFFGYICRWNAWTEGGGPQGVAVGPDGLVYVLAGNAVGVYTNRGVLVRGWQGPEAEPDDWVCVSGIAVDDSGYVYVADACPNHVQKFTNAGTLVTQWGSAGCGPGQFESLQGVAVDGGGNVYTVDGECRRVQKFTRAGAYLTQWGSQGSGDGAFEGPTGIATDRHGHVYVVDYPTARVQKFTSLGGHLATWSALGTGLAVGDGNEVYIVDPPDAQVFELDSTGVEVRRWGGWGRGDGQFMNADEVAVDHDGDVFVAEGDGPIQRFGMATRWLITATAAPGGSIRPGGDVYVAEGMDQSYRMAPDLGQQLAGVSVDGSSVGPQAQVTFADVTSDHSIAASFTVACGWPTDPLLNLPVCTDSGSHENPVVVPDGAGGAIFAWRDYRYANGRSAFGIRAQRVDARGLPCWSVEGVTLDTASVAEWPVNLLADGSGGAVVLWCKQGEGPNDWDLYAQRVDAAGEREWGGGATVCNSSYSKTPAGMVSDGAGGGIVVWSDGYGGLSKAIRAQHLSASGLPTWGSCGVALRAAGSEVPTAVASDDSGGVIAVWEEVRNSANGMDLYAQRVDAAGVVRWTAGGAPVCTGSTNQWGYGLAPDGAGGIIVAWTDCPVGEGLGTGFSDIYAQHLSASGAALWGGANGVPLCTAAGDQYGPGLVADGAGGAIVAWFDGWDGADIRAQRVTASGAPLWAAEGAPVCTAAGSQYWAGIVPDDAGGAILGWADARRGAEDIYAQRVNPDGSMAWATDGVPLCTAAEGRDALAYSADGSGGLLAVWRDNRDWHLDVYAQRVDHDGALGGSAPTAVLPTVPPRFALEPVHPNPLVSGPLLVRFSLPRTGGATVQLLDVTGRRILTRDLGSLGPGTHSIALEDGARLAPGLYFLRVAVAGEVRTARAVVLH
jgi:hypothetical protein